MKKLILTLLSFSLCTSVFSQDSRSCQTGSGSYAASRDATALSMVGWGFAIAVGIATLCALIENDTASSSATHSHSH